MATVKMPFNHLLSGFDRNMALLGKVLYSCNEARKVQQRTVIKINTTL